MFKHVTLTLHEPEETIICDFSSALTPHSSDAIKNPITDYFDNANGLVLKIIQAPYGNDSEILGLLVLGIVSSAEFYFRAIISELVRTCPICESISEAINIPVGSNSFYLKSGYSSAMSAFEHESLADSKKITGEIKRFVGFQCQENSSVKKALDDFELLCEIRHCFVHARGFAGLKAARALKGPRTLQVVRITQAQALDFIKLAHNAVRAVNHYLCNEVLNRWIEKDELKGTWVQDKKLFTRYWKLFAVGGEDKYTGDPRVAYQSVQTIIKKRKQGMAAQV